MDFESQQVSAIVVGIGLNLQKPQNLDATLKNKVGGMVEHLTVSRNVIVAALLDEFVKLYAEYTDGSFLTAYRQRNIVINQTVTVKYGKELVTGIAKAIDEQGQLLVDTGDVIRTINSGEVLKVQLPNNIYQG